MQTPRTQLRRWPGSRKTCRRGEQCNPWQSGTWQGEPSPLAASLPPTCAKSRRRVGAPSHVQLPATPSGNLRRSASRWGRACAYGVQRCPVAASYTGIGNMQIPCNAICSSTTVLGQLQKEDNVGLPAPNGSGQTSE